MKKYSYVIIRNLADNKGERAIRINQTGEVIPYSDPRYKELDRKIIAARNRQNINEVYKSLGLNRVKGANGGTYYE